MPETREQFRERIRDIAEAAAFDADTWEYEAAGMAVYAQALRDWCDRIDRFYDPATYVFAMRELEQFARERGIDLTEGE
jgi:hypothetical protein